jgi:transposase
MLKCSSVPIPTNPPNDITAVLKMQINKSDRNDASGIARIMQTGWFKAVQVKDLESHAMYEALSGRMIGVSLAASCMC